MQCCEGNFVQSKPVVYLKSCKASITDKENNDYKSRVWTWDITRKEDNFCYVGDIFWIQMDSAVMAIVTAVWKQFHEDLLIMSMSSLDVTNYYTIYITVGFC